MTGRTRRRITGILMLSAILGLPQTAEAALDGQRSWWWHRPAVQHDLHLTAAQVRTLDRIYAESLPRRRALRRRLDLLEREFAQALRVGVTDGPAAGALVQRLTDARRRSNITRTLMLVRMLRVLQPAQRERLGAIADRAEI